MKLSFLMHASGLTPVLAFTFTTGWELFWRTVLGCALGGRRSVTGGDGVVSDAVVTLCGQISKFWPAAKRVTVEAGVVMSRLFAAASVCSKL